MVVSKLIQLGFSPVISYFKLTVIEPLETVCEPFFAECRAPVQPKSEHTVDLYSFVETIQKQRQYTSRDCLDRHFHPKESITEHYLPFPRHAGDPWVH